MMHSLLSSQDWLALFGQFVLLSLLSVSGAVATVPEMHRFLVHDHRWMSDTDFTGCIAIAQAAPGPNVLFVALLGWRVGVNAGGGDLQTIAPWVLGGCGMLLTMAGIILPSCVLTYSAARWSQRNRHRRSVRAFRQGMGPLVVGLLLATGWVLVRGAAGSDAGAASSLGVWATALVTAVVVWRTRLHLLWLLGAGALLGALGWV